MNVGQLKQLIQDLDDSTVVLVPFEDHGYRECHIRVGTALKDGRNWTEDHGEDLTPEADHGKRTTVLLID